MRCPECHSLNPTGAAACTSCGLLLFKATPHRRAEDLALTKRRTSDLEVTPCRFCGGEVVVTAVRCRHCSEILDETFYRQRAQRIRKRVNYTSWVAYLFGLAALLVFRPVGLVSIAAGLLLSIAYYAIPVEPPEAIARDPKKKGFVQFLKRQTRMERVSISVPRLKNRRLILVGTPLVAALVGYAANLFLLQAPMDHIIKENSAFQGMEVSTHYEYWVVPGVVICDLRSLSFKQTPIDVHTAFLEFAKTMRARRYTRVELSYRGIEKFSIDGGSFHRVGIEYARHNFDYVLYRIPSLLRPTDGGRRIADSDRDALLEFHRRWYGEDTLTKSVQNGM